MGWVVGGGGIQEGNYNSPNVKVVKRVACKIESADLSSMFSREPELTGKKPGKQTARKISSYSANLVNFFLRISQCVFTLKNLGEMYEELMLRVGLPRLLHLGKL